MTPQPHFQIPGKRRFGAAKYMRAAANIQNETLRRIQRTAGGIAFASVGKPFEKLPVRLRIMVKHRQIRDARPRIGKRHAGRHAQSKRSRIAGDKPHGPTLLFNKRKRNVRRFVSAGPDQPFRRQNRQKDRQITARREKFCLHDPRSLSP